MHQKSPQFALEFAQTPELNDGINPQEARAMMSIYNLIKDLNIPKDLFEEKGQYEHDMHKIIMEWRGNSDKKSDWSGWFMNLSSTYIDPGRVYNAQPIGFEQGEDEIDYAKLKQRGDIIWNSTANDKDTDGMIVTFEYPIHKEILLHINGQLLRFTLSDLLSKNKLMFAEKDGLDGLEGKLIIRNAYKTDLTPELLALKEMVLAGKGDNEFSAPLQALLWGYMDGKFKEGDNPFETYKSALK